SETFRALSRRVRRMVEQKYTCWNEDLRPALEKNGIRFLNFNSLTKPDQAWIDEYYRAQVRPVLTPLALDPAHPFPQLLNKSLNIVVQLDIERNGERQARLAVGPVPTG